MSVSNARQVNSNAAEMYCATVFILFAFHSCRRLHAYPSQNKKYHNANDQLIPDRHEKKSELLSASTFIFTFRLFGQSSRNWF